MKIRSGFVSNSSSSSFACIGYDVSKELEAHLVAKGVIPPPEGRGDYADESFSSYLCDEVSFPDGIETFGYISTEGYALGVGVDGLTAQEILEKTQRLKEFLKMEKEPRVISDGGYNG